MLKVLFVASEAAPFAKTGGLGDVVGALPKELRRLGVDARVVMPKYGDIPSYLRQKIAWKKSIVVPVGWRQQFCGIEELEHEGVPFYFIDNEYYFKRPGHYGYGDDGERFSYFCRAALEILPHLEFIPDILHLNDWHTGMVAALLASQYRLKPDYGRIRTVFTIHNLEYQGVFPKEVLSDLLGLGWELFHPDGVEFYGGINFMKAGIVYSDAVTTVSETYAGEIQDPFFGFRLDGVIRARRLDLSGILNGIDYDDYNPEKDPRLFANYSWRSPKKRLQNKTELQKMLGLAVDPETPLVGMVCRLVKAKGLDLVVRMLDEIILDEGQMVVLGTGEEWYESALRSAAWRYPSKFSANIFFDENLARKIYAGSDMFLMPSLFEPCGIGQLIALRYGSVPIVRETGGLKDTVVPYNEYTGEGNGFSFTNFNAHDMLYTIRRAKEFYKDKKVWSAIQRAGMRSDFSITRSAKKYLELYCRLGSGTDSAEQLSDAGAEAALPADAGEVEVAAGGGEIAETVN